MCDRQERNVFTYRDTGSQDRRMSEDRPLVTPAAGIGYGAHAAYCWRRLALKRRGGTGRVGGPSAQEVAILLK